MSRLYLLGGEDVGKRSSRHIMLKAVKEAGAHPTVLIFPWTGESLDNEGEQRALITEYFMDLGAETVQFAEPWDPYGALMKKARSSDIVYLPGGNPQLLIDRMLISRGDEILAEFRGTVIGNSAGALALCRKYAAVVGQKDAQETRFFRGFGELDFAVTVHYMSDDDTLAGISPDSELESLSEKSATKIYAISDNSALVYEKGKLEFIGYVFQFHRGNRTRCL
ncbi:MAG: Type 1 glutamine amidotransferase-like domain-containing protein [Thermoplasmata archaeon]|nr:Type 1 glutamine amidotransferase-like domain-containing protein [Thermoplasmata archaeon]